MCGIAGFIGEGDEEILSAMTDSVSYRGPDDRGVFFEHGIGLGHRRLSILDLSPAGHQPMFNAERTIGIVFNGEIYNFKLLREKLVAKGLVFQSTSDTEVLVYLYQVYGESFVEKINGMFALALYDFSKKKLILVRDRLGKKPLYWAQIGETLLFGSELKVLRQHPLCPKEIDLESLNQYLQYDAVLTPKTIISGVSKLEPGSFLVYENNIVTQKTFWRPDFVEKDITLKDALIKLDQLISQSVQSRLVADVPVGVFLSGGLDSSTIAYYASKHSTKPIETFSIGFAERSFDESAYAEKVAKHLGTNHHTLTLTAKESLDLIPFITDHLDEPMADASILPTFLLSRFTKQSVTVALGGDGGDELFAGYPTFIADYFAPLYRCVPESVRRGFEWLVKLLPASEKNFNFVFKLRTFMQGVVSDPYETHMRWLGSFNQSDREQLLRPKSWAQIASVDVFSRVRTLIAGFGDSTVAQKTLGLYLRTYLMDQVLVKVDRASMYASLEARSPLLDYQVVDFINSLPYSFKLRGLTTKYILKKLMADKLPKEIVWRPKKGFGIPMTQWLKHELKPLCDELFSKELLERQGLFNHTYILKLLDDHRSDRADHRKKIWNLLLFQMWWKRWEH